MIDAVENQRADVVNNLNELLDISSRDVMEQMRSRLNPQWEEDYAFYLNQQSYPQTQSMHGWSGYEYICNRGEAGAQAQQNI